MHDMFTKVKICGVTTRSEIELLDELNVTYAGLWLGIPKGAYNLDLETLSKLTEVKTRGLKFILVTMNQDILFLCDALETSNACGIQFQGFQLPAFIKKIKQHVGKNIKLFKVLHVHNNECMEEDFIERYLDAGVDIFILDTYQDKNKIGSTGISLSDDFLAAFLERWQLHDRVMIAGGVNEHSINHIYRNFRPYGVDIDSAARCNGKIDRQRIEKIMSGSG